MKLQITLLIILAGSIFFQLGAQELIKNSGFETAKADLIPDWRGGIKDSSITYNDKNSARVEGNTGSMTQSIKMEKGALYKISAWIYKGGGKNAGRIGIRSADYKWKFFLEGSVETAEWRYVEGTYRADGTETYFYCYNQYMGDDGAVYYSSVSVIKIPEQ